MAELIASSSDEARERLLDQVLGAITLSEIVAAGEALDEWMADHPDEPGMADGFELLSHREDFAREREAEDAHGLEAVPPSLTHA